MHALKFRVILPLAVLVLAALALVAFGNRPVHASSYTKNGVSITISATCPSNGTTVTELTRSGGNPGFAARVQGKGGTWYQGSEVAGVGSESTRYVGTTSQPVQNHGIRVFWAGGAQDYTFCG